MKKLMALMSVVMMVLLSCTMVMAGDGNGGGDSKLELTDASSIKDGQTGVKVDEEIKLVFSNNVVNMKVKDTNMTSFTMTDADGNDVAIEVLMGDDQVNQDIKNDIVIKPTSDLKAGASYTIAISDQLQAKNGSAFKGTTLTFETAKGSNVTWIVLISGVLVIMIIGIAVISKKRNHKESK